MIELTIVRLAAGLALLVAANIVLGSIGALLGGTWDVKKLRNGCLKAAIVAAALAAVYLAGWLNPDLLVIEAEGQTVNLMTAVYAALLAAFGTYALDVVKKLKGLLGSSVPGTEEKADGDQTEADAT